MKHKYIGHHSQISGVEEHRLVGGKGDGLRLLEVRNGQGLHFTVSVDRGADISRLFFKGDNYGFFAPSGYVAPAYYDDKGTGFLKSFTAGFLTTCGLTNVGAPSVDEGEELPLHGTVNHTPAEQVHYSEDEEKIVINAVINQMGIFSDKLMMYRRITCFKSNNRILVEDQIENLGDRVTPLMILYHTNIGYPLLSEQADLYIPSSQVSARNPHAEKDIQSWGSVSEPQPHFIEQCYYHKFAGGDGLAGIYNPDIQKGLLISFDANSLDYFVQWKMLGEKDYVLGLEPGNCHSDGRDIMRSEGTLKFIQPGEQINYAIAFDMIDGLSAWEKVKEDNKC